MSAVPPLRPLATGEVQVYLSFLHTPFSVLLLIATILPFARHRSGVAGALLFGAAMHFALDLLQRTFGGGISLLYPLDLTPRSWQTVWYENPATYVVVPAFGVYLVWLATRPLSRASALVRPSASRCVAAALPLAVCAVAPLACIDRSIEMNLGASRLASEPSAFENRMVELPAAAVMLADDEVVELDVMAQVFRIGRSWLPEVGVGDHVSVRGTYSAGWIEPEELFVHDYTFKRWISIAALLLMVWFWWPGRRAPAAVLEGDRS